MSVYLKFTKDRFARKVGDIVGYEENSAAAIVEEGAAVVVDKFTGEAPEPVDAAAVAPAVAPVTDERPGIAENEDVAPSRSGYSLPTLSE